MKATPTGAVTRVRVGDFNGTVPAASRASRRAAGVRRVCFERFYWANAAFLWEEPELKRPDVNVNLRVCFRSHGETRKRSSRAEPSQNPRLIRTETAAERREPVGVFILSFVSFCELYWYVDACLPAVIDQSHFLSSVSLTEKCLKVPLLPATLILCSFLKNFGVCFCILSIWVYWSFTEMLRYDRKVYNDGKIYL